jgi:hypothetical protein
VLVFLAVEIVIGFFVHDSFVRPYLGYALVVILIWCVVRIVIPDRCVWLSGAVFLFAVIVEVSQIFPLCDVLGIENRFLRTLMGTSFAWGDIIANFAGCAVTAAVDLFFWGQKIREKRVV